MITKFNNYLILEKTDFNKFKDLTKLDLNLIFNDNHIISNNFVYEEITLDELFNHNIGFKFGNEINTKNGLLLISDKYKILVIKNLYNDNKYHIIDFIGKHRYNYKYDFQVFNSFFKEIINLNINYKCYILTFDKDIKMREEKGDISDIINDAYQKIYYNIFKKYYEELYKILVNIKSELSNDKNIKSKQKYYLEIHNDINNVYTILNDKHLFNNKLQYITYNDIFYKTVNTEKYKKNINYIIENYNKKNFDNEFYNNVLYITRIIAFNIFKHNKKSLHYEVYKDIEKRIDNDNSIINVLKNNINDPRLIDKYKHLFDASNFDLI